MSNLVGNTEDRFSHNAAHISITSSSTLLISNDVFPLDSKQFNVSKKKIQACNVMILNFRTDRSGQTVQTQIRLLLEEQSDQGLHCLLFHLHVFDKIPSGLASLFEY